MIEKNWAKGGDVAKKINNLLLFAALFGLIQVKIISNAYSKEYIVKLSESNSFQKFTGNLHLLPGLKIKDAHKLGRLVLVGDGNGASTGKTPKSMIEKLEELDYVEYVVPNIQMHSFSRPDDPNYSLQWALPAIDAQRAWDYEQGSRRTVVAVIDTGVDFSHEDLVANIWRNEDEIPNNGIDDDSNGYIDDVVGWDFFSNDNSPSDETSNANPGHGTHCAGIIGAVGNNGVGVTGAVQQVSIMVLRFLGSDGSGSLLGAIKAIDYALNNGADIINASWGNTVARKDIRPLLEAIKRARRKNVLFVAAAGNDGLSNDSQSTFPANAGFTNVISVAASNEDDRKPNWSNYGRKKVSIAAPGESILSTLPFESYGYLSGTSMATPVVAGAAALLRSYANRHNIKRSPAAIKAILTGTGDAVDIESACGCRVNLGNAIKHLSHNYLTLVPTALTVDVGKRRRFKGVGGRRPYMFTSSDPDIATINKYGLMKAVSPGTVSITVQDSRGQTFTSDRIFIKRRRLIVRK